MTAVKRPPRKTPPRAPAAADQQGPVPAAAPGNPAPGVKTARKRRPRFVL
jgi:hypothetical protein